MPGQVANPPTGMTANATSTAKSVWLPWVPERVAHLAVVGASSIGDQEVDGRVGGAGHRFGVEADLDPGEPGWKQDSRFARASGRDWALQQQLPNPNTPLREQTQLERLQQTHSDPKSEAPGFLPLHLLTGVLRVKQLHLGLVWVVRLSWVAGWSVATTKSV